MKSHGPGAVGVTIKKSNFACVYIGNILYDSGERCGPWASCYLYTYLWLLDKMSMSYVEYYKRIFFLSSTSEQGLSHVFVMWFYTRVNYNVVKLQSEQLDVRCAYGKV
jgi:hypothetical protein